MWRLDKLYFDFEIEPTTKPIFSHIMSTKNGMDTNTGMGRRDKDTVFLNGYIFCT